jgi:hypothetical protein
LLNSPHHSSSPTPLYQSTPRVIYPLSTYLHGNPGFYCDLMQSATRIFGLKRPYALHLLTKYIILHPYLHTTLLHFIILHLLVLASTYTPYIPSNPTTVEDSTITGTLINYLG